jgi:6-phosphogluconolactonase (cycloisomerase 2 family)
MRAQIHPSVIRRSWPFAFALAAVSYWASVTAALAGPVLTTVGPSTMLGKPSSVAFSPVGPGTRLLAATDEADNTVSIFKVSPGGVVQGTIGLPSHTGGRKSRSVAFSRDGALLATANRESKNVSVFPVHDGVVAADRVARTAVGAGPNSVAFSPREGPPLLATADQDGNSVTLVELSADGIAQRFRSSSVAKPNAVAFSRDGAFVATANTAKGGSVTVFRVMPDLGLEEKGTTRTDTGSTPNAPSSVAFSPISDLLVAANPSGTISAFTVGPDGVPHRLPGSPSTSGKPSSVAFSSDGALVATANHDGASVSVFKVSDDSDRALTPVPLPAHTGTGPVSIAFSGRDLLATADDSGSLSMFAVSARGALTPVAPHIPTGASSPNSAAFSSDGKFLAVTHQAGDSAAGSVAVFAQSDGAFNLVDSKPTGRQPLSVAFGPGNLLAVANERDDTVLLYPVDGTGRIGAPVAQNIPPDSTGAARRPFWLAFSRDGRLLATANVGTDSVSVFEVMSPEQLRPVGNAARTNASNPVSVAFGSQGLLATANQAGNSVSMFRASTSGVVRVGNPIAVGPGPHGVAFSSDGSLLAAANREGNSVSMFSVSNDGRLSLVGKPTATGAAPISVAFSPRQDQGLLVTSNQDADTMSLFRVAANGALTEVGSASPTGDGPNAVAFSMDGLLATPNLQDGTVSVFTLAAPALDTYLTTQPPARTNATTASFTFEANYPSTFECKFHGGGPLPCVSPAGYSTPKEGRYTFNVRAKDLMGTEARLDAPYEWVVDLTPPKPPSLLEPAKDAVNLPSSPVFRWSPPSDDADVARYELWIDDAFSSPAPQTLCGVTGCPVTPGSPLAHGRHTWAVRSVDEAGNRDKADARTIDVDAAPPEAFELLGPEQDAATSERRPVLSWQAAVDTGIGVGSYRVLIDEQPAADVPASATSFTPGDDLAEGAHRWQIAARDLNGNERLGPTRRFIVDVTPPVARMTAAPNPVLAGRPVTFDASTSSDAGSGIVRHEWDLDGNGTFERDTGATANVTHSFGETGAIAVQMRVTDRAGLTGLSRIEQRVTAPPTVASSSTGISINNEDPYTNNVRVTVTAVWPPSATGMLISNDGGFAHAKKVELQTETPWTLQATGDRDTKIVYVRFLRGTIVIDKDHDDIVLDEKRPDVASAEVTWSRRTAVLRLRALDHGPSGLSGVQITNDPKHPRVKFKRLKHKRATITLTKSKWAAGLNPRKKLYVRVQDRAGNRSKWRVARRAGRG